MSTRKMSTRKMSTRKMSTRKMSTRKMSTRNLPQAASAAKVVIYKYLKTEINFSFSFHSSPDNDALFILDLFLRSK